MANNPGDGKPSYHEVPAKKYIFLFEIAIHKRFFFYFTITLWTICYLLTRVVNLDMLILAWHLQNLWVFLPYTAIIAGSLFIWKREVTRTARIREKQAAKEIAYAKRYIDRNLNEVITDSPPYNPQDNSLEVKKK